MKLFGIFSRRLLMSQRAILGRNLGLVLTGSALTYLSYNYMQ